MPWYLQPEQVTGEPDEVLRGEPLLEADEVGAEEPAEDLRPQRHLHEQLDRRERNVEEEADPQVGSPGAQHRRHELQLVVVHPDSGALAADAPAAASANRSFTVRYASRHARL